MALEIAWINALVREATHNPDKHRVDRRDDILWIVNSGYVGGSHNSSGPRRST